MDYFSIIYYIYSNRFFQKLDQSIIICPIKGNYEIILLNGNWFCFFFFFFFLTVHVIQAFFENEIVLTWFCNTLEGSKEDNMGMSHTRIKLDVSTWHWLKIYSIIVTKYLDDRNIEEFIYPAESPYLNLSETLCNHLNKKK